MKLFRSRPSRALVELVEARAAQMTGMQQNEMLPPGPYRVGLTNGLPPYTVTCGDGRAICTAASLPIAYAIMAALAILNRDSMARRAG